MYEIVNKLKLLKAEFRRQRQIKGNLTENVKRAKGFLDKAQELFATYKEDILLHLVKCCRQVCSETIKLEISMLKQRAKLRWMKHGDQNSKVFFRKVNSTRAKQRVFQIKKTTGEVLTEMIEVTQEFISYFQSLLGGSKSHRVLDIEFLRQDIKHILTTDEANQLIAPVTRSEIKAAFFDIDKDSASDPDGYTSAFFRAAWPVVGQAISDAIGDFFRTGMLLKQINTTLLALIPKVNMPTYVSDYRPISCCNVLYKAITKIIVKRMQLVLHLLVDYSQNAFVPGRNISDNILLAQELLAGYNQVRLPSRCTLKVDIQKAYDSVEWDFLLEVLRLFNFPPQFIKLIEQCVSTVSYSISLNGSVYGFFKGRRGLRQGDPMSPYLFVLVMEIWSSLLRYRVKNAAQFQYHWKCKDVGLINLCFADDALLFCKAHIPSIRVLTDSLNEFAALSGLTVNPAKSQIILSRAVQQERQQIIDSFGFQEGMLPVKYLGVPLTSSRLNDC
ncbi:UNVERIFIED_CONTAM: Retrovirus-related Pol polyprotein from type-1 retrotransposable element R2 [Sesamum radiatum]|uniref:Retrovirus-related Pol polyprotein from type-1 retrotransposable element R2 n=1 Tax=Sesamum radiatum TaxID=300843 RepID=A0AAW2V4F3_SESRA